MKKYVITVLGISWGVTGLMCLNPKAVLNHYGWIMFIPWIVTVAFNKMEEKKTGRKGILLKKTFHKKAILFGCLYPIGFIMLCAGIALITGQATVILPENLNVWLLTKLITVFVGLFSAFGEEYGWRGYLLPHLTEVYGKRKAVLLTGVVWMLYHIPAVYLLAKVTGVGNPLLVCAIQAACVFTLNFAFSFDYYLSESIIPVILFHSIWNTWNTAILGDLYNGKQGIVAGTILFINGEGVLGLILSMVAILYFCKKFDFFLDKKNLLKRSAA